MVIIQSVSDNNIARINDFFSAHWKQLHRQWGAYLPLSFNYKEVGSEPASAGRNFTSNVALLKLSGQHLPFTCDEAQSFERRTFSQCEPAFPNAVRWRGFINNVLMKAVMYYLAVKVLQKVVSFSFT